MFCGVRGFGCMLHPSGSSSRRVHVVPVARASRINCWHRWCGLQRAGGFRRDVSSSLRVSLVTGGVGDGDRRLRMERLAGKGRAQARSKRNSRHASERRSGSSEGRPTPQLHVAGRTSLCLWSLHATLTSGRKSSRFHVRFRIYEIGKKIKV